MDQEQIYQEQIEAVNLLIYEANENVRDLQSQKERLLVARYMMRTGLKNGDVVTWAEWVNHKGEVKRKGRIIGFDISFDRVQPVVNVCTRDGAMGKRIRNYWAGTTQPIKM